MDTLDYISDTDPSQRVARGMEWLDEHARPEWWDLINLDTLSISDPHSCVLGQVFRPEAETTGAMSGYAYVYGYNDRHDSLTGEQITALGFSGCGNFSAGQLREAWTDAIQQRVCEVYA